MDPEPLAIEIGPGAEHDGLGRDLPCYVGERVRRIGNYQYDSIRDGIRDFRHDLAIDFGVLIEQLWSALRIVAVGRSAGLFVHAGRDEDYACIFERIVITVCDFDPRANGQILSKPSPATRKTAVACNDTPISFRGVLARSSRAAVLKFARCLDFAANSPSQGASVRPRHPQDCNPSAGLRLANSNGVNYVQGNQG
jgi:hypothetical protein